MTWAWYTCSRRRWYRSFAPVQGAAMHRTLVGKGPSTKKNVGAHHFTFMLLGAGLTRPNGLASESSIYATTCEEKKVFHWVSFSSSPALASANHVYICLILSDSRDCPWALSQGALLLWTWPRDLRQRLENHDVCPNHDKLSNLVISLIMTLIRSNSYVFFRLLHPRPFVAHIKSKLKKLQKEAEKSENPETPKPTRVKQEPRRR